MPTKPSSRGIYATRLEDKRNMLIDCNIGDGETIHTANDFLRDKTYLSFSVESPNNPKIQAIIQNLMTTVGSDHPIFSKWW